MKITVKKIISVLDEEFEYEGNGINNYINNIPPLHEACSHSLIWISPKKEDKQQLLLETKASVIFGDSSLSLSNYNGENKILIKVKNPRLTFIKVLNKIIDKKVTYEISKSASIHPEAEIDDQVYIGANTNIGKCKIGKGTIIYGNCSLYDNVQIGENTIINAGSVIGADGFGYAKSEENEVLFFPHIGGVIIGNNVTIGANTCIDRGTLGNTIIENNVKIDNLVHIAHNVVIEENAFIIALAMIGGGTRIKKDSWISPSSVIRNGIEIGENCLIGMGSVVTKNIEGGGVWLGNPARKIK